MNGQYIAFAVVVLANVLPLIGVSVGSADLTTFIQVGVSIVGGLIGIISGWRNGVHTLGGRNL